MNDATILLCETIRALSPEQLSQIVYDGRSPRARALADFWDEHEADEAELQRLASKLGRTIK